MNSNVRAVMDVVKGIGRPDFSTSESYNLFCKQASVLWHAAGGLNTASVAFVREREYLISSSDQVIKTSWGGVHVTSHKHPHVEKYLIVDSGKYLAFEMHEEKTETLSHVAGDGILVMRNMNSNDLEAIPVTEDFSITLLPGQEHCLISLNNLLVFERSTDPKGMDQDLIFIHCPTSD